MTRTTLLAAALLLASFDAVAAPCDRPEIQAHLAAVEAELLAADTGHLTGAQLAARVRHINALAAYRERCRFPRNVAVPGRLQTIFVDHEGTHCAVGHLLAIDGEGELVDRISATANLARIQDLAGDAEFEAWLVGAGLSAYEAARIQPGYPCDATACVCRNAPVEAAMLHTVITAVPADDAEEIELEIAAIYGDADGFVVGDRLGIEQAARDKVGQVLVLEGLDKRWARHPLSLHDGKVSCLGPGGSSIPVNIRTYIEALRADDCPGSLERYGGEIYRDVCHEDDNFIGCSAGSETTPSAAWPWLLLALGLGVVHALQRRASLNTFAPKRGKTR